MATMAEGRARARIETWIRTSPMLRGPHVPVECRPAGANLAKSKNPGVPGHTDRVILTDRDMPSIAVTTVDPGTWDELLLRFPARQVFHRRAWLDLLASSHGLTMTLLRLDAEGQLIGLWPVLGLRKGPLKIAGSPLPGWSTAYLGPLFTDGSDVDAAVAAALQHEAFRSTSYIETRVVNKHQKVCLAGHRFDRLQDFETYVLDLDRPEESVWEGLESRCRNTVRKAQKQGLVVRAETDDSFLDGFWQQSLEVFGNWGLKPGFTRPFLQAMWQQLVPAGLMTAFSAFEGDRRAASMVILHDDQTAYYQFGATDRERMHLSPNNLLLWEVIRAMQTRGIHTLDMVSSSGTAGKFKRSFGPSAEVMAVHWGRSRTAVEAWMKRSYERFLRWRNRRASPAKGSGTSLGIAILQFADLVVLV